MYLYVSTCIWCLVHVHVYIHVHVHVHVCHFTNESIMTITNDNVSVYLIVYSCVYILTISRLGSFMGIANSFDQYPREWHQWFTSDSPETTPLPGK